MKRGGGGGGGAGSFVPTSDCRFNCHGMIYVSEGKLIVTNFQLLAPLVLGGAPIFKPRRGGQLPPWSPRHWCASVHRVINIRIYVYIRCLVHFKKKEEWIFSSDINLSPIKRAALSEIIKI